MKILIVKLSSLGDVVQTLPVLHDMRAFLPSAHIDWAVEEAFADLLRQALGIARVLPCAQRRWRKRPWAADVRAEQREFLQVLRKQAYDAVIDFQGLIKSALVARSARLATGGFSVTYGNRSELCAYEWPVRYLLQRTVPMPRRVHAVARYRLLAAAALGYRSDEMLESAPVYPWAAAQPLQAMPQPLLQTAPQPLQAAPQHRGRQPHSVPPPRGRPQVMLAHGTTRADNQWPEPQWLALGRLLTAAGFDALLPQASEPEARLAERLAQSLGAGARVLPRMNLAELLDVMRHCSGLVGVDSGVSHMGVALDLPLVQIFSQPRAWRAGPVGRVHQSAVGGDRAPDVQAVWQAWQAAWAARPVRAVLA